MRQAGLLAAAGLYSLEHMVSRLQEDHTHARIMAEAINLAGQGRSAGILPKRRQTCLLCTQGFLHMCKGF